MVSRFRYTHMVNQYIRGRRPFSYLVKIIIIALAGMLDPYVTLAIVTLAYAFSGPGGALWRLLRYRLWGGSPLRAGCVIGRPDRTDAPGLAGEQVGRGELGTPGQLHASRRRPGCEVSWHSCLGLGRR